MTTNVEGYGLSQIYLNNELAHNMNWETSYDGENLNLAVSTKDNNNNNNTYFIELSNDDILNLLNYPVSKKTLDNRLLDDFNFPSALAGNSKHHKHHKHHRHHKHHKHHKHSRKSHYKHKKNHSHKSNMLNKKTRRHKIKKNLTKKSRK